MSLTALLNQPLTIQHRETSGTDPYGNQIRIVADTDVTTGYVEQTQATEIIVGRETYTSDWLVVLRPTEVIRAWDAIAFEGQTLEVIGQPHQVWNPRTRRVDQIECRCREIEEQ